VKLKKGGPSLSDSSSTKRDTLLPCHVIPLAENRDFHRRKDVLQLIDEYLLSVGGDSVEGKGLKTFALCGPGGMGKTQVANEYAITHTETYKAILWVHAETATTVIDEFS
jgi:hypothetical protein